MQLGFDLALTRLSTGIASAMQLSFLGGSPSTLDPRITFTRADATSCATYFDSDGLLKTMGANYLKWSNDFSNAVWSLGGTASKTGTNQVNLPAQTDSVAQSTAAATSAAGYVWTFSCMLSGTGTVRLLIQDFGGAFPNSQSSNITLTSTPTLYQLTRTQTDATATQMLAQVFNILVGTPATVIIGNAQFERSAVATTYSPTQATATSGPRFDYDPATPAGTTGGELNPQPTFASSWTSTGTATVAPGDIRIFSDGTFCDANCTTQIATTGKTYQYTITISSTTGGGIAIVCNGGQQTAALTTVGTFTGYVVAGSSTIYTGFKRAGAATDTHVSFFSLKEVTFAPRGLLIEESRTNLLLQSRDMTQAAWSNTDITPAHTQVGIDGAANAATLMTDGASLASFSRQAGAAVTAGSTVTGSYVLKRGNTDWIRITVGETGLVDGATAWFNLGTGAKGATAATGAGSAITSTMTSLGGGWYRCALTVLPNGVFTVPKIGINSSSANSSGSSVSGGTYIVDAAQLEVASVGSVNPSTIIFTGASTIQRAAEVPLMTGTGFSSWFNPAQGTFVVEFDRFGIDSVAGSVALIQADDNTSNNRICLRATPRANPAAVQGTIASGGSVLSNDSAYATADFSNGAVHKFAFAYQVGVGAVTRDGLAAFPVTSVASLPTVTQLGIGLAPGGGAVPLNGHIRRLTYYNTRLADATLQSLTL
ncbi:MAG: hypothetical protein HXX17_07935 [Geobacteraceae bacterium]|nr:hypothetical protein [Geobacteraceae bacterium]